jgi:hypothetical protein
MPRVCTVCSHEERRAIDKAIANGGANRRTAARYGLTENSIRRHKAEHLSKALVKAAEARVEAGAENILGQLVALIGDCRQIGDSALSAGKHGPAVQALKAVTSNLELIARLTGQLGEGSTTVNIALVQQAKAEEDELVRLKRLTPDERNQLRGLLAKMESVDAIEVEAIPVTKEGQGS